MDIVALPFAGLKLVRPRAFADARGFFLESYRKDLLAAGGIDVTFVQDNHSRSLRHTIRGLHFQRASARSPGQAKLVRVGAGRILDVVVDLRREEPTFGKWHAQILDDEGHAQLFIPIGFAHGYCVLSETADVLYKATSVYDAATEAGFAFDDPDVGIDWPVGRGTAILSKRDETAPPFRAVVG